MDSIHSWIDTEEVKKLAESLSAAPEKRQLSEEVKLVRPSVPQNNSQDGEEVAREIPAAVVERQKHILAGASAMANTAGLINRGRNEKQPPSEKKISAVKVKGDSGTFEEVETLLVESLQAQGICAVDRDGDVLFDSLCNTVLSSFIVSILENASVFEIAEGEVKSTRLKTYANQLIEFIAVRSSRGVIVVAILLEKGMSNVQVDEISVKLVDVLNK